MWRRKHERLRLRVGANDEAVAEIGLPGVGGIQNKQESLLPRARHSQFALSKPSKAKDGFAPRRKKQLRLAH
jgi:hypothetical protein